jgi:hypothetical protein
MLKASIARKLKLARYKLLKDGTFFGEIPGARGVWAKRAGSGSLPEGAAGSSGRAGPTQGSFPHPHRGDVSRNLLTEMLRQAGISSDE